MSHRVSLLDNWNIRLNGMVEKLLRLILGIHQVKSVLIVVTKTERKHYQLGNGLALLVEYITKEILMQQ